MARIASTFSLVVSAVAVVILFSASAAQAVPNSLSLSPNTASNPVGTTHTVTATVTDGGNPVEGVTVYFAVNLDINGAYSGYCSIGYCTPATTDENGEATYSYSSSLESNDTIYAFADPNANAVHDAGEPGDSAAKVWRSNPAATLTPLEPATSGDLFVDIQQRCVSGFAQDSQGSPSVRPVVFTVTGANPQTKTENSNTGGGVGFCYTGENAGDDTITAFVDNNRNGTQEAGEPSNSPPNPTQHWRADIPDSLSLTPETATNDIGTTHTVTATVTDGGNPVEGVTVYFAVNLDINGAYSGYCSIGYCTPATTDENGEATYSYSSSLESNDTIYAFADPNANAVHDAGEPGDSAAKVWRSNPAATLTPLEPATSGDLFVDIQQRCVSGFAQDSQGSPSVRPVVFTVTGANPQTKTENSNTGGGVGFCYTGENAGDDTITAFVDNNRNGTQEAGEPSNSPPNPTQHWRADIPDSLSLTPETATNDIGTTHTVTATVTDGGNPVEGVTVYFAVNLDINGAYSGYCSIGYCTPATTDENGEATYSYSSSLESNDTIYAFADPNANAVHDAGEPGDSAAKVWRSNPAATLTPLEPAASGDLFVDIQQRCVSGFAQDSQGSPSVRPVVFTVTGANPQTEDRELQHRRWRGLLLHRRERGRLTRSRRSSTTTGTAPRKRVSRATAHPIPPSTGARTSPTPCRSLPRRPPTTSAPPTP